MHTRKMLILRTHVIVLCVCQIVGIARVKVALSTHTHTHKAHFCGRLMFVLCLQFSVCDAIFRAIKEISIESCDADFV